MTLGMDVLRWLTVRALRGRTWALDHVYDSPAEPADVRIEAERQPFLAVYTDDGDIELGSGSAAEFESSLGMGVLSVNLVVEIAVAAAVSVADEGDVDADPSDADIDQPPGTDAPVRMEHTDEGLEANIGLISRQVFNALLAVDNPWAELWRKLVFRYRGVMIRRGGPGQQDRRPETRMASRLLIFRLDLISDPMQRSGEPSRVWRDILAAMDGDEEMAGLSELIVAHIDSDKPALPDWRIAQKLLTTQQGAIEAIGIAPVQLAGGPPIGAEGTEQPVPLGGLAVDDGYTREPAFVVPPQPDIVGTPVELGEEEPEPDDDLVP